MKKTISFIIPTYNMENYLPKCLNSLVIDSDHMEKMQVFVVNDGSKDKSSEIAHSFAALYPDTFIVIDKQNGNYGSCINTALLSATGKYVKVLDSDDYLDNRLLPAFIDFLDTVENDMIISDVNEVDCKSGDVRCNPIAMPVGRAFCLGDLPNNSVKALFIHHITYKRSVLDGYRQTEGVSYTDLEWTVIPSKRVTTVVAFPYPLYQYVLARDGQTVSPAVHAKNMYMERDVIMSLLEYFNDTDSTIIGNSSFTDKKISFLARSLYDYYLLSLSKYTSTNDLIPFDKKIKLLLPQLYSSLDSVCINKSIFRFRYIHEWRKRYSRNTILFSLYDMYQMTK